MIAEKCPEGQSQSECSSLYQRAHMLRDDHKQTRSRDTCDLSQVYLLDDGDSQVHDVAPYPGLFQHL